MWFQLIFFPLSPVGFLSKQGKVFHEAVASCRLAFSSLTLGPAPVPAGAGGARARSPRCPPERSAQGDPGAGPAPAHGCSPPRAPRGAAPCSQKVRRLGSVALQPGCAEPGSARVRGSGCPSSSSG